MAKVGLLHAVAVPISSETRGSAMNYGTAVRMDPMMKADLSFTRSNQKQHGDNAVVESDNGITGGKIVFDPTDLTDAQQAALLGHVASGSGYVETDAPSPYVGFGYVRVKQRTSGGVTTTSWIAYWIYKVQFSMNADNAETKKDSVTFQNPTLDGDFMGVFLDGTGRATFRYREEFATEAEAIAAVDALAGLSLSQVATPAASTGAGAVASGTEITLTCGTSGATIYYTTNGDTPTTGSMVYAAGIKVYEAMTIKAIAAKSGMTNSEIMSEAYTISE